MTLIQQQRLVGATLLLIIVGVASNFLISSANQAVIETNIVEVEDNFTSTVQPLISETVEVVDYADETLLDPQNISPPIIAKLEQSVQQVLTSAPVIKIVPTPEPVVNNVASWIVQLASFSVKANAEALVSQLTELGYSAFIENSNNKGVVYRVRLSPVATKDSALTLVTKLKKHLKLQPQILQFSP